ncbi:unnamed protein product [Alternaria alternata]
MSASVAEGEPKQPVPGQRYQAFGAKKGNRYEFVKSGLGRRGFAGNQTFERNIDDDVK